MPSLGKPFNAYANRFSKRRQTSVSTSCTCTAYSPGNVECSDGRSVVTVHDANDYCNTTTTITVNGQIITINSTNGHITITYGGTTSEPVYIGENYCGPQNPYAVYPYTFNCP